MFSLRPLDSAKFGMAVADRALLLVAAALAWKVLVAYGPQITGCADASSVCSALAAVLAVPFYAKALIYLIFALSLTIIAVRRLRDASLPAAFALVVAPLTFADLPFGLNMFENWMVSISTLSGESGRFVIAAFAILSTVCVFRSNADTSVPWRSRLGGLDTLLTAMMAALAVSGLIGLCIVAAVVHPPFAAVYLKSKILLFLTWPGLLAATLAPALFAPIAIREWRASGAPGLGSGWSALIAMGAAILIVRAFANAVHLILGWVDPSLPHALVNLAPQVWGSMNYAAVIAALILPTMIGKMLTGAPTAGKPVRPSPPLPRT